MDAIEVLVGEHRLIERVCAALVAFAGDARRRGVIDAAELRRFVRFIREFVDQNHHAKEEGVLFEAMIEAGFPRHTGPVAVMLAEHAQGRLFVDALDRLAGVADPTGEDRQQLFDAATSFASLLRDHIHTEDAVLYPMAEHHLSAEARAQVDARCERFEAAQAGLGPEALRTLGEALARAHLSSLQGAV